MQFNSSGKLMVDPSFGSSQWHLCNYTSTVCLTVSFSLPFFHAFYIKLYNHTYEFTGETFARIRFDFTVRRKSTFYMLNIVFPCSTLSMIQLLGKLLSEHV